MKQKSVLDEALLQKSVKTLEGINTEFLSGKLTDSQFADTSYDEVFKSSIGMNIRHILDFWDLFLQAVNEERESINFLERKDHSCIPESIQRSIEETKKEITRIISALQEITENKDLKKISERGNGSLQHTDMNNELNNAIFHTAHHLPFCFRAANAMQVNLDVYMGYAPSTLKNQTT